MNKKELSEIKSCFSSENDFLTVNRIATAFVDAEKNIRYKNNQFFHAIPSEMADCLMLALKKVFSGSLGKSLREYPFPNEMYGAEGSQTILYNVLGSQLKNDNAVDAMFERMADNMDYPSAYMAIVAHCTYSYRSKDKNDEYNEDTNYEYSFLVIAVCPVEQSTSSLVYNEDSNELVNKSCFEKCVAEVPTDGFLFPVFSDRAPDINHVLYYSRKAKNPNLSIVEDVLGCEFTFTAEQEKSVFDEIVSTVVGDDLDYSVVTAVNEKVREIAHNASGSTELPVVDDIKLHDILMDAGISDDKLEALPNVFETYAGNKPLIASNLIQSKTEVETPDVTVNISNNATDKVRTSVVNGRRCLLIDLDDPRIAVNGLPVSVR